MAGFNETVEGRGPQATDEFLLGITPDWLHRALVVERTGAISSDTFVEEDRSINCLNDFEQGDLLRRAGKRNATPGAAGSLQQASYG